MSPHVVGLEGGGRRLVRRKVDIEGHRILEIAGLPVHVDFLDHRGSCRGRRRFLPVEHRHAGHMVDPRQPVGIVRPFVRILRRHIHRLRPHRLPAPFREPEQLLHRPGRHAHVLLLLHELAHTGVYARTGMDMAEWNKKSKDGRPAESDQRPCFLLLLIWSRFFGQPLFFPQRFSWRKTLWKASIVRSMCSSVWAIDRNTPSNWDGGRKMPSSAMSA